MTNCSICFSKNKSHLISERRVSATITMETGPTMMWISQGVGFLSYLTRLSDVQCTLVKDFGLFTV